VTRSNLAIVVVVGVIIVLQLIPVNQTNPAVIQTAELPPEVQDILVESCFDCHSNETEWPWYSRIAPGSFLITRDVIQGRKRLNFSDFSNMDANDSSDVANEIVEMLEEGKMPLLPYLLLHPDASLSDSESATLIAWAESLYPE